MQEIIRFKAYCLERYKFAHNLKGSEALRVFEDNGVMDYIESFYDVLHTYGDRQILIDIDEFIASRKSV